MMLIIFSIAPIAAIFVILDINMPALNVSADVNKKAVQLELLKAD